MRWLPLVLLTACAGPELLIVVDGVVVDDGDVAIDLGSTRRHRIASGVEVRLSNIGTGRLDIDAIRLPEGVSLARPELPISLRGDDEALLRLGLIALEVGAVEGEVSFEGDDPRSLPVFGQVTPYVQTRLQDAPDLDAAFDAALIEDRAVGAAAAIVERQDIVWMRGFGQADREADIAVDPTVHRFRWASLSKGLTAVTIADAVRDGRISFDDTIDELYLDYRPPAQVLPEGCRDLDCAEPLPDDAEPLTLRHLLSHTGGVQHYTNGAVDPVPPLVERNDPEINTGMAWALDRWIDAPLVHAPGEAYSYSTFGYNLAGVAFEEEIRQSLARAVQTRIAEPLELTTLGADRAWEPAPDRVAHYRLDGEAIVRDGDDDVSWKLAGGGFTSSVQDLARYCAGLLGDVIIDPRLRDEELWVAQPPALSYGLGFRVEGGPGARLITHTGAQQGTRTALRIHPDEGRCYVFMTNSTWVNPSRYTRLLAEQGG